MGGEFVYNRYIPQPDGTHERRSMPDAPPTPMAPVPQPPPPEIPVENSPARGTSPSRSRKTFHRPRPNPPSLPPKPPQRAGDFLRNLLPAGLDTGDLLVIVLLLLIAGDCRDDRNTALLTLALYLFL